MLCIWYEEVHADGCQERIQRLRQKMAEMNMDAYVIPSSDPHMSEYVAPGGRAGNGCRVLPAQPEL